MKSLVLFGALLSTLPAHALVCRNAGNGATITFNASYTAASVRGLSPGFNLDYKCRRDNIAIAYCSRGAFAVQVSDDAQRKVRFATVYLSAQGIILRADCGPSSRVPQRRPAPGRVRTDGYETYPGTGSSGSTGGYQTYPGGRGQGSGGTCDQPGPGRFWPRNPSTGCFEILPGRGTTAPRGSSGGYEPYPGTTVPRGSSGGYQTYPGYSAPPQGSDVTYPGYSPLPRTDVGILPQGEFTRERDRFARLASDDERFQAAYDLSASLRQRDLKLSGGQFADLLANMEGGTYRDSGTLAENRRRLVDYLRYDVAIAPEERGQVEAQFRDRLGDVQAVINEMAR
jgi:hypothetical protein